MSPHSFRNEDTNKDDPVTHVDDIQLEDVKSDSQKADTGDVGLVAHENTLGLWQTIKAYPVATCYCAFAAFGSISDGYQYALPGSIVALPGFIRQMGALNEETGKYALDPQHVALWGGLYTVGYIIILLLGSWPADKFGRKPMLFMIQFFMAVACIVEMFATVWWHWAIAKILNGLSVGLNQMTLMTYISELAPSRSRGALLGCYSVWWSLGKFLCALVLKIMDDRPVHEWRRAVYSMWAFTGTALIVWLVVPESPRWLCERGRDEAARKSLLRLHSKVKDYDLEAEYGFIQYEVEHSRELADSNKRVTLLSCFKGTNLRRTFISFAPFAWQQWGGNAVVNTYTAYFFDLAGVSDPFLASLAIYLITIICQLIAPLIIETMGRRRPILIAGVVMIATLFSMGGMLKSSAVGSQGLGIGLITIACVWELFYASTLGVIGYVYLGETSTVLLRAKTTGVAAAGTGFLNLIVNYCTPLMLGNASFGPSSTMVFYGGTCTVWLVIAYFFIPETKGRSYLELDELFERRISARKFATTETKVDIAKRELIRAPQV